MSNRRTRNRPIPDGVECWLINQGTVNVQLLLLNGKCAPFFRRDLKQDNVRVALYRDTAKVDDIVAANVRCAHECGAMAGILAVESIGRLLNLTDGADVMSASL